jgi:hypothetical protein
MWSSFHSLKGEFLIRELPASTCKGIVYISLDFGIAWNYLGGKLPTADVWTWCSVDTEKVTTYVDKTLVESGFFPIFYTQTTSKEYANRLCSHFTTKPPVFIGINLDLVHQLIIGSWAGLPSSILERLPPINTKFEDKLTFFNVGPENPSFINYTADDLNIGVKNKELLVKTPQLLVLMGQPGSGKTTTAKYFLDNGWIVIDEKTAQKMRRSTTGKDSRNFYNLVSQIGVPGSISQSGVVVDCTNPKKETRDFYIEFAKKAGKSFVIGWITRPGFYFNQLRPVSVPMQALYYYAKHLEPPTSQDMGVRLV